MAASRRIRMSVFGLRAWKGQPLSVQPRINILLWRGNTSPLAARTIGPPRWVYGAGPIFSPHDLAAALDAVGGMFPRLAGTIEGHAGAAHRRISRLEPTRAPPPPLSHPEGRPHCPQPARKSP